MFNPVVVFLLIASICAVITLLLCGLWVFVVLGNVHTARYAATSALIQQLSAGGAFLCFIIVFAMYLVFIG